MVEHIELYRISTVVYCFFFICWCLCKIVLYPCLYSCKSY